MYLMKGMVINMVIFLTSSFVEYHKNKDYEFKPADASNGFVDNLKKYWVENAKFLVFSSYPSDVEMSEGVTKEMYSAFSLAGLSIGEIRCFDDRYIEKYCSDHGCQSCHSGEEALEEALKWADVFYLSGGHAPTENAFIKKCNLKRLINDKNIFDGIFIGLSAGSMNTAQEAYLIPELEGESVSPDYIRFTEGLGLTNLKIIPHINYYKNVFLDGKHMIDDIAAEDSFGREFYLITDGSYFVIRNGVTEFFGEGMILKNGLKLPLNEGIINAGNYCDTDVESLKEFVKRFDTIVADYYDEVFELDSKSGKIKFFHISSYLFKRGLVPVNIDSFDELNAYFAEKFVVKDEKQPFLEMMDINKIIDEIKNKQSYVLTVHINTEDGIKAECIRIKDMRGDCSKLLVCMTDISMILDHDWLTDEYSWSGFQVQGDKLLANPKYRQGYSLVYTNIQGFKAINDLLGSYHGDMIIFQQRDLLAKELEPDLIARLDSDHFALITKTEHLTEEKLDKICHQSYIAGSKCIPILIRCGIYHIDDSTKKIIHMLDRAKIAEKSISADHGIAYAVCDKTMSNDYVNQRVFVSEIDKALENGEFLTYYQPIVDTLTGEIVSAEALIRWNSADKGMISPGQFIPVFEREGLITKLDSFMVSNVINFNIKRMREGKKVVPCAVNLSRVDFYDTKLLEIMKNKLSNQKNIQDMLKLEVTESAYAVLESDAIAFLNEMKKLGLALLLDDFGSGMSSLSTLETFEFDIIKLDMGFIRKIGRSVKAEGIIKHTIGLSHDVGAKVVAEGVETAEQLEFLKSVDCDMIQGYYFYKPMPEEEFEKLL